MIKMKVNWILEQFAVEDYFDKIIECVNKFDDNYVHLKSFEYYIRDLEKEVDNTLPTVALCSIQTAREINRKKFIPGAIYSDKAFEVNRYYKDYHEFILNKDYMCLPFWSLVQNKDFIFNTFGNNDCVFIRPNSGGKSFTGFVTDKDNFECAIDQAFIVGEEPYELVCISEPKNIKYEWRIVIIDGKVISGCRYKTFVKRDLIEEIPDRVIDYAKLVVESVKNPPQECYIMDVAETSDGLSIVELNSMSCSGLYKCDISKIMVALRDYIVKNFIRNEEWQK